MFFENTIDKKPLYVDNDGNVLVDLGETIFSTDNIFSGISLTLSKVAKDMDMRPDIVSRSVYGDEKYTELILKYNDIQNPFSLEHDQVLVLPSSINIDKNIMDKVETDNVSQDSLIRQYHKYIDKSKNTDTVGSEQNKTNVPKSSNGNNNNSSTLGDIKAAADNYKEANLANIGARAIKEIDGKLYFGADSDMKCATDGIATADYLKKIIQNSVSTNE